MKTMLICLALLAMSLGLFAQSPLLNHKTDSERDGSNPSPYNLMAAIIDNDSVMLCWENPTYIDLPMGFKVYCNNHCVVTIRDDDANNCTLDGVCEGCHQFWVTAFFDSGTESDPSNIAEVTITANEDNLALKDRLSVQVYPNPCRGNLTVKNMSAGKSPDLHIAVYNLRGQLVSQNDAQGSEWMWNGKDTKGSDVPAGVYYLKATDGKQTTTKKFTMQ